jgi:uncharacterized membrane protein
LADDDAITSGCDWPSYCFWAAAQILRATGDEVAANHLLERARGIMKQSAKGLEPEDRTSFLALFFHRDIAHAAESGAWPDPPR